jgi:hypothetical protein
LLPSLKATGNTTSSVRYPTSKRTGYTASHDGSKTKSLQAENINKTYWCNHTECQHGDADKVRRNTGQMYVFSQFIAELLARNYITNEKRNHAANYNTGTQVFKRKAVIYTQ